MRLDQRFGFDMALETEAMREPEPTVVVLVDPRGRRLLVPVACRPGHTIANVNARACPIFGEFISGTIH